MVEVCGETAALAEPSLGWMGPGQVGHCLGCCGQFTGFFNLLKGSVLTGLQDFITTLIFFFPSLTQILR